MIVVCTGCSAKFRVADEKIGTRGAKLRCSKCQTVFTVQRPDEVPPPPAADPFPVAEAPEPRAGPPPLPRRTTLDARAAFEVDLEPHLGTPHSPADPFAPAAPAPAPVIPAAAAAPEPDPFYTARGGSLEDDPFAAPPPGASPSPPPATPAPSIAGDADFDPFTGPGPGAPDPLDGFGPLDSPPAPVVSAPGTSGLLSLEELTTPPARRLTAPSGPAPMPVISATEDPFGAMPPLDHGLAALDEGVVGSALPSNGGAGYEPAQRATVEDEPPLQLDPFGAAAVAADPLAVEEPRRAGLPPPAAPAEEPAVASPAFRVRDVLVSAMALAALLLLALAILVVWRGGLAPADALRPSAILAALAPRPVAGELSATGVTSGLYERAVGAPLLFVRGTVVSSATTPLAGVRVLVEVVRDGAVLARGEAPVGDGPGPEALHAAVDAAALARALADAAPPEGSRLAPGGTAPFLIAFIDYPSDLAGASLRIRPLAGEAVR
jgi:predicted Zn finger-like uncharacterized protein